MEELFKLIVMAMASSRIDKNTWIIEYAGHCNLLTMRVWPDGYKNVEYENHEYFYEYLDDPVMVTNAVIFIQSYLITIENIEVVEPKIYGDADIQ